MLRFLASIAVVVVIAGCTPLDAVGLVANAATQMDGVRPVGCVSADSVGSRIIYHEFGGWSDGVYYVVVRADVYTSCGRDGKVFGYGKRESRLTAEDRAEIASARDKNRRALEAIAAEAKAAAYAASQPAYSAFGATIHTVVFSELDAKVVVTKVSERARTTLRVGDRIVRCDAGDSAERLALSNLVQCRSEYGHYGFVVERDDDVAKAVLLPLRTR